MAHKEGDTPCLKSKCSMNPFISNLTLPPQKKPREIIGKPTLGQSTRWVETNPLVFWY